MISLPHCTTIFKMSEITKPGITLAGELHLKLVFVVEAVDVRFVNSRCHFRDT